MNRIMMWTVAMGASALAAAPSFAATYNLTAGVTTVTMPGRATPIPMWGYGLNGGPVTIPGPTLTVQPGDPTLTITLTNNLPVETSIVIPGLTASFTPVRTPDAQGRPRVRSFTATAAPGGTATYTWTGVRPGTYVYHSGAFPALQVQMGLYGVVKQDVAPNTAYPGVTYTKEVVLVYSEIDPDLPARAAAPDYSKTRGVAGYTPRYFLVNGQPYTDTAAPLSVTANDTVLLRLVNAGLRTHVPTLLGGYFSLIAEDANLYQYSKKRYSANLPPLKTIDAIWTPGANGTYPLYDRGLDLYNDGALGGGLLTKLVAGAAGSGPVAANDAYTVSEDTALAEPAPGVLANDTTAPLTAVLVSPPTGSSAFTLNADGSFTYTPKPNYNGADTFTYKARDAALVESNVAAVTITVTPVNDSPVAVNDSASTTSGAAVTINVLANDTDIDGDALIVTGTATPSNGTAIVVSNQVQFTPNCTAPCTGGFTYTISDGKGGATSATVTVSVSTTLNQLPQAVDDAAQTPVNIAVTIDLIANDVDPDGTVVPSSVVLSGEPSAAPFTIKTAQGGTAANQKNGTVIYTPRRNFRGTDTFTYTVKDNLGAASNPATVRVNVVR